MKKLTNAKDLGDYSRYYLLTNLTTNETFFTQDHTDFRETLRSLYLENPFRTDLVGFRKVKKAKVKATVKVLVY